MPAKQNNSNAKIEKGSILVYRVFDIAEEIDLAKALQILGQGGSESRLDLSTRNRTAVVVRNPPVRFRMGEIDLTIEGHLRTAEIIATVWDYGALSLSFQIPIRPGTTWNELVSTSALLNADDSTVAAIDERAKQKRDEAISILQPALKSPTQWTYNEDYIIYFLERVEGLQAARSILDLYDVPSLILGEVRDELAHETREALVENTYQYAEDDLVVIDWNSALVVEPSGVRELADVLEFALTQLLEVRYFDDLLDKRLASLYDSIELNRKRTIKHAFSGIAEEANTRFLEISEFTARMSNSLKFVGDFYLARIYRGALRRFRILDWEDSITRKMQSLARVSELIHGEANVRRSHMLEAIVVILILFEIVSALIRGHG